MSHVLVTLFQNHRRSTAPDHVEVHPVPVLDPRLEMSLIAVRLLENVCELGEGDYMCV